MALSFQKWKDAWNDAFFENEGLGVRQSKTAEWNWKGESKLSGQSGPPFFLLRKSWRKHLLAELF